MEATVLGDLQCCRNVLVPFNLDLYLDTILSLSSITNSFLPPPGMVFALTCSVNCGTFFYRCVCLSKSCPTTWIYHCWILITL
jgi:arginine exporter protein ArgO